MGTDDQVGSMRVDGHLGGYVQGGDEATYYPDLWRWLVERGVRSVMDIGCGDGVALKEFASLGCRVLGLEGIEQDDPDIIQHDFTLGPFIPAIADEEPDRFDLVWCCEFVEHVEAEYEDNFLATMAFGDLVLMTHAEPGQAGWHHVNCQWAGYWIERLLRYGYDLDKDLTNQTRAISRSNTSPWNHYARSGLAFRRVER
jgi:SAM-dependent methyltransferase